MLMYYTLFQTLVIPMKLENQNTIGVFSNFVLTPLIDPTWVEFITIFGITPFILFLVQKVEKNKLTLVKKGINVFLTNLLSFLYLDNILENNFKQDLVLYMTRMGNAITRIGSPPSNDAFSHYCGGRVLSLTPIEIYNLKFNPNFVPYPNTRIKNSTNIIGPAKEIVTPESIRIKAPGPNAFIYFKNYGHWTTSQNIIRIAHEKELYKLFIKQMTECVDKNRMSFQMFCAYNGWHKIYELPYSELYFNASRTSRMELDKIIEIMDTTNEAE